MKSISAIEMFKAYPQLKQFYSRCGVLWSRGYFVSTVGHISEATVKKYIREQELHDQMKDKLSVKEYEDPFKGSK